MTKPVLHLVVSDMRHPHAVGASGPGIPQLRDYAAAEFGSGWYHEAAIAASEPAPSRTDQAMRVRPLGPARSPARPGLTLVP